LRANNRPYDQLRPVNLILDYMEYADGSAYMELGKTKVIATATIEEKVPIFLKNSGTGWITAEYSMLPCSTEKRTQRERNQARISGRTHEIQRLIGRSLRDLDYREDFEATVDMNVVTTDTGSLVEIQASAEKAPMSKKEFEGLLSLAEKGIKTLIKIQKEALKEKSLLFMAYG